MRPTDLTTHVSYRFETVKNLLNDPSIDMYYMKEPPLNFNCCRLDAASNLDTSGLSVQVKINLN